MVIAGLHRRLRQHRSPAAQHLGPVAQTHFSGRGWFPQAAGHRLYRL